VIVKVESMAELAKYEGKLRGAWVLLDEATEPRKPSFEPRAVRSSLEELLAPPRASRQKPPWLTEEYAEKRAEEFRRLITLQNQLREGGALGVLRRSRTPEGWRVPSLGIIRGSGILGDIVGSLITPGEPEILPNIVLSEKTTRSFIGMRYTACR
jgi:hypothetical protein